MRSFLKNIVVGMFLGVVCGMEWASAQQAPPASGVSPEQQKRMERMKSEGPEASLTILPVRLPGTLFDHEMGGRVSEVIGAMLEQQGLKNIELGKRVFEPGDTNNMEHMALSLGEFVRKNPITTEYALYAEYQGKFPTHEFDGLCAVVVDKAGAVVWTDRLTKQDEAFRQVEDPDPMGYSVLLVERLSPPLGLNEETAKNAKPGKLARLMDERSGLPPESESAPLPERQNAMKKLGQKATLVVFPARIRGTTVDVASATNLANMINEAGLCKASAANKSVLLKAPMTDPNELKVLWDLARDFKDYAKRNPVAADYVLYADYVFTPQHWEQGIVHFVVCDRKGEWVIVDMQNSCHPDYQSVKPTSREDCDKLLIKRLERYLR